MYHPVNSFDEKLYICETCHKHHNKNEIPFQAVSSKVLKLKHLKKLKKFRKSLNFKDEEKLNFCSLPNLRYQYVSIKPSVTIVAKNIY